MKGPRSPGPHCATGTATAVGRVEDPGARGSGCGSSGFMLLGPRSETLSDLQLELLADEEPGSDGGRSRGREPAGTRCTRVRRGSASRIQAVSGCRRICRGSNQVIACAEPNCRSCGARDGSDRLRRKRAIGCGTGAVFRAQDQAGEAGMPELPLGDTVRWRSWSRESWTRDWRATGW